MATILSTSATVVIIVTLSLVMIRSVMNNKSQKRHRIITKMDKKQKIKN